MIPRGDLVSKPIKLRNELIFYLGHIPTFFGLSTRCPNIILWANYHK